jgi:protein involved in polysaccharide export with SLBB domain
MSKLVIGSLAAAACSLFCSAGGWAGDISSGDTLHVIVSGEVHVPGSYAIAGNGSIDSALTQAGGVDDMAADTIYVERADEAGQIKRYSISLHDSTRLDEAHLLREGDKVVIPHAPEYSITGEVKNPGTYRLDLSLTVAQAVAKANGGTMFANLRRFEVRRKEDDRVVVVQVNPDAFVQPDDVIRVKVSYP